MLSGKNTTEPSTSRSNKDDDLIIGPGRHSALVDYAVELLKAKGFKSSEIFKEYPIWIEQDQCAIKVDVVGINESRKVAIECGTVNSLMVDKPETLRMLFDEYVYVPYLKARNIEEHLKCLNRLQKPFPTVKVIAVTKVYGRGRTQIPDEIRDTLGINPNEDKVVWMQMAGTYYIKRQEQA